MTRIAPLTGQLADDLQSRAMPVPSTTPADSTAPLSTLKRGQAGRCVGFDSTISAAAARRLFDLGFVPGAHVSFVRRAPMGDPMVVSVSGIDLAMRRSEAAHLLVTITEESAR